MSRVLIATAVLLFTSACGPDEEDYSLDEAALSSDLEGEELDACERIEPVGENEALLEEPVSAPPPDAE